MNTETLLNKIKSRGYWMVEIRPTKFDKLRIPTLSKAQEIIQSCIVTLRGWDYPHLSHRDTERTQGVNWVASWADFMGHLEYWRFYQSTQFLHLFSIREATEERWRSRLQELATFHLSETAVINGPRKSSSRREPICLPPSVAMRGDASSALRSCSRLESRHRLISSRLA